MTTPDPSHLTWSDVCARRLDRHGLSIPVDPSRLVDVVRAMCGAHAQVMSAAEISIGIRVSDITRRDIHKALWEQYTLVKTYGPRGTVHLLPAVDLPMWTGALSFIPGGSVMPPTVRMTPDQTDIVVEAIGDALLDAEMTVDELTEAIVARTGTWAGDLVMPAFNGFWPRWRQATATAANRGALIFGPPRGRKVTYTNPRRCLPDFAPQNGQIASAALLRHYLHSYGPATPAQYARWLSIPREAASGLFMSWEDNLAQVDIHGETAWVNAGDTATPDHEPNGVWLLPYFDAYGVGSYPREKVFPGRAFERALAGGQAGNFPVLLIDGVVAGVWHHKRSGRKIHITVEPLAELSGRHRDEIDARVSRIGNILEAKPVWEVGTVTTGPHA